MKVLADRKPRFAICTMELRVSHPYIEVSRSHTSEPNRDMVG
jgi:hypothetical protein